MPLLGDFNQFVRGFPINITVISVCSFFTKRSLFYPLWFSGFCLLFGFNLIPFALRSLSGLYPHLLLRSVLFGLPVILPSFFFIFISGFFVFRHPFFAELDAFLISV